MFHIVFILILAMLVSGKWREWKIYEGLLIWGMVEEKDIFCKYADLLIIVYSHCSVNHIMS